MKQEYYAVAVGRKPGIYKTWAECEEQVKGYSKAEYKSFKTEREAKEYLKGKESKKEKATRICLLCERPSTGKTELCASCQRKKKALAAKALEESNGRIDGMCNNTDLGIRVDNLRMNILKSIRH